MQESARAALSWFRSRWNRFGLEEDLHKSTDIHVHVPEGAIPKDGPSAGITIATAMVSGLLKIPVRRDVAMTGEITLRGRVLPIGGLKEKALGAIRGGIRTVIVPEKNRNDLTEIPAAIKRKLTFIPVGNMKEILPLALEGGKELVEKGSRRILKKKAAGKASRKKAVPKKRPVAGRKTVKKPGKKKTAPPAAAH